MELGDIWAKIANNARLSPQELQFLKLSGRETQQRNSLVAGNIGYDGKLKLELPFSLIFSEVLETDKATVTVSIPGGYRHLRIEGSGRNSEAVATTRGLCIEINGDGGANYNSQYLFGEAAVVTAGSLYANLYFALGDLVGDSATAGKTGSFVCEIPHYGSSTLRKSGISTWISAYNSNYRSGITANYWDNTSPITQIKFFVFGGYDIIKGSILSVYGIL